MAQGQFQDFLPGAGSVRRIGRVAEKKVTSLGSSFTASRRTLIPPTPESKNAIGSLFFSIVFLSTVMIVLAATQVTEDKSQQQQS
jgi:hypothetical protein